VPRGLVDGDASHWHITTGPERKADIFMWPNPSIESWWLNEMPKSSGTSGAYPAPAVLGQHIVGGERNKKKLFQTFTLRGWYNSWLLKAYLFLGLQSPLVESLVFGQQTEKEGRSSTLTARNDKKSPLPMKVRLS